MDALSSGGLHQTGKDTMSFQSAIRSGAETYLAEDHQMPERLFCVVVRGRYAGAAEEGKEKFLFGSCEIGPEGLGGFEAKRLFADPVQFRDGAFFDLGRRLPGDMAGFKLLPPSQSRAHRSLTRVQKGPVAVSFSVCGKSACSALISLALVMIWARQICQSAPIPL